MVVPKCGQLFLVAAMCAWAGICTAAHAAEQPSQSDDSEQKVTVTIRLVDVDGKPVADAHVGHAAEFGEDYTSPADESGWHYWGGVRSDSDGIAHLTYYRELLDCVVARHAGRKLVAIQILSPEQFNETITVTMRPESRISGRLVSTELAVRKRAITWSNVYLYSDKARAMGCISRKAEFHFYVPAGTYKLEAYGMETFEVNKSVTVLPGQHELEIEPIRLPTKPWVLLEGKPAPELEDVVAWKNGGPIKLSDLRGKVVLLEFWGHWCGPCIGAMPKLFSMYDEYRDKGLEIIGVHVDIGQGIDSVAKLDEKLAEIKKNRWNGRDIPFPVALVLENKMPFRSDVERQARSPLAAKYGINSFPTGILIDRQGNVAGIFHVGYKPDEPILEKLLKEKYVETSGAK